MLSPLVSLCFPRPALNNAKGAVRFGYPHALSNTSLYTHLCKCRHLVHHTCARDPAPGCQGVGLRQRLQSLGQKQLEEVPDSPPASATEMWGAFEVTTAQVETPQSGPRRKSFVFKQRGKFFRTLVFPLKQISEKLFSGGSGPSCSPSPQGWEERKWAALLQQERWRLDGKKNVRRARALAWRPGRPFGCVQKQGDGPHSFPRSVLCSCRK